MNRAQRRKMKIEEKPKTYTVTADIFESMHKIYHEASIDKALVIELLVTIQVLRDRYGFGKKRLQEFVIYHRDMLDSIEKGYLDYNDMQETIKEETGFDYFGWKFEDIKKKYEESRKKVLKEK